MKSNLVLDARMFSMMCGALLMGCAAQESSDGGSSANETAERESLELESLSGGAQRGCALADDLVNAPPVTTVDGLRAVPIDIGSVDAKVVLDATAHTAAVEVTMTFRMGPSGGYPIFDLRQTIGQATLNGADVNPAKLAAHNFGGGSRAELRVIETELRACSYNTLRLTYALEKPSSPASIPIAWAADSSRVHWDFWLSDLYAGRYLEQWFPSNLVYDKFAFDLDIELRNSAFAHSAVTNGAVETVGESHWHIAYPKWFTALSPMLELVPDDSVVKHTAKLQLSRRRPITLDLVKETAIAKDLPTLADEIRGYVEEFAQTTGRYPHGDRLTVYIWTNPSRSMEFDGATTSNLGSLKHELFHSWYGRGVKPASQNDGWIDEAWTVYNTGSAAFEVRPLDPNAPPATLSSVNPWSRITPYDSYGAGEKLFAGLASAIGLDELRDAMKSFYAQRVLDVVTTPELERHLYCASLDQAVTNAFHRFVYGQLDGAPERSAWDCLRPRAWTRPSNTARSVAEDATTAPNLDIEPPAAPKGARP